MKDINELKIIAHRGFSQNYPENTMLAFEKALQAGADGIETDLQLSSDGEVVLFHDDTLKDITGAEGTVQTHSLADLQALDAGKGEHIPTLDELLRLCDARATLILEIKYDPLTYRRLCTLVADKIAGLTAWIEVSCFEDKVLEYIYTLNPQIRLHKLIDKVSTLRDKEFENKYAYVSYLDIAVKLRKTVMKMGLFQKYKVIFWTVKEEDLSQEEEAGLYGIMKDNPTR